MGTARHGKWDLVFPSGAPGRVGDMFATAVVADAVRRFDADLAQQVETCRDWQRTYRFVFRGLTALAASSPAIATGVATDGLHAARSLLRFVTGHTIAPLQSLDMAALPAPAALDTVEVTGAAKSPDRLEVPLCGRVLAEESLLRQLTDWRRRGIVEPGFAAALERVVDHPEWLSLPGFRMVVTGAAAELGPLRPLLSWGADVLAIDLPGDGRWQELSAIAQAGAGRLRYPVTTGPGADITRQFPALVHWIRAQADASVRPVFGLYASVPGPQCVRLAAALDVLAEDLLEQRSDAAIAFVGTPTDCYAVPEEVIADAHARLHARGLSGVGQNTLRMLTGSRLFRPSYRTTNTDQFGATWSVADALLTRQGPNHALAQRLLRWRAMLAHSAGRTVSCTVAPPAWTKSVLAQRSLSASYRGAHRFGIEVFEPDTARTLLAAKLVADLHTPQPPDANPEGLFAAGAAHGGLWRQPFEPTSILPVAAAAGYLRSLSGRR